MCKDEEQKDLEKSINLAYKAEMKSEFYSKLDDLFNQAINKYIDEYNSWSIGVGRCLEYVRDYIKENI